MVLEARIEYGLPAQGVHRSDHHRDRPRCRRSPLSCRAVGQQLGVAFVEPSDGVAEAVVGEDLAALPLLAAVHLGDEEVVALDGSNRAELHVGAVVRVRGAQQRERVAECPEGLLREPDVSAPPEPAMQCEHLGRSVRRPGWMVDHFHRLGVGGEQGCLVARLERGLDALGVSRGRIRAHEAGGSLRHLTGDQRIEARASLGFVIGLEPTPRARAAP